jgi:hypothetical protein
LKTRVQPGEFCGEDSQSPAHRRYHSPASLSASRSRARFRPRDDGRISGFGGCKIAPVGEPVQDGNAWAIVGGVHRLDHPQHRDRLDQADPGSRKRPQDDLPQPDIEPK